MQELFSCWLGRRRKGPGAKESRWLPKAEKGKKKVFP